MKIWKILLMVLAVAVGAPTVSMAAQGHGNRTVASAKAKKKGKKAKGAKNARGKKKHGKGAKGKKGKKAKKAKKLAAASHGHKSHAPAQNPVQEPVPSVEIPQEAKDDLPPPNTGNLSE
jgi:Ni/Co efflux regulator RcnB